MCVKYLSVTSSSTTRSDPYSIYLAEMAEKPFARDLRSTEDGNGVSASCLFLWCCVYILESRRGEKRGLWLKVSRIVRTIKDEGFASSSGKLPLAEEIDNKFDKYLERWQEPTLSHSISLFLLNYPIIEWD